MKIAKLSTKVLILILIAGRNAKLRAWLSANRYLLRLELRSIFA